MTHRQTVTRFNIDSLPICVSVVDAALDANIDGNVVDDQRTSSLLRCQWFGCVALNGEVPSDHLMDPGNLVV